MALYTTKTLGEVGSIFDDIERQELERQQRQALEQYNASQAKLQQAQSKQMGPLESVLTGIGNSIKNVGDSLGNMFGTGLASLQDLVTGNAMTGKYTKMADKYFKEKQYGDANMSDKDYFAKTAGKSLDAAVTLSDLIPVAGGAKAGIGKIVSGAPVQIGQGVLSGVAQQYAENGENATLEDALRGGLVGGASSGVGRLVGGKLAGKTAGKGLLSKAVNSNIGKAAITGATAGATGGGLNAALSGGDLGQILAGAGQGAQGGALGGATMAGVMGLAGAGLDKLKNKIETPKAIEPVAQIDTDNAEKTTMVGRALKNAGNDLESAQTNITRAERRKFGIKDAGETVDNLRKRTGFSNLDDQAEFAKNITGGPDSVMDTIQKYNISVDEAGNPITLRTDQYEVAINDAVGKGWQKSVMGESYDDFRKNLISDIQNQDPITAANNLKSAAAVQRGIAEAKGPTSDKAAVKAKIYTEVANKIDDLSYSAVPQKNVNRMFDDTITEFYTRAQEAAEAGNKSYAKAYENLAKELEGTERTINKYRTFKKDFVKSSQLAEISRGAQSGSLEAGNKRGNVLGRLVNTITEEPVNRALAWTGGKLSDLGDAVNRVGTGKIVGGVGNTVSGLAGALNNSSLANTGLGDIAMRQLVRQSGLAPVRTQANEAQLQQAQQQAADAENLYNNTTMATQAALQNLNNAAAYNPGEQQLATISKAMELALNAGDFTSYSKLADLYQQAYKIYGTGTQSTNPYSNLSSTQVENINKLDTASNAIDELEALFNQAGGGQGLIGGNFANWMGSLGLNSNVATYNALSRGLINQIGAAIGKTDSLNTEGEVNRALELIPKMTDDAQTAQNKLAQLRQMLNANKQTVYQNYGIAQ